MLFAACGSTSPCFNAYCDGYQSYLVCNSQFKPNEIDIKVICRDQRAMAHRKLMKQVNSHTQYIKIET